MRNTSLAPGCSRATAGSGGCASLSQLKRCTEVNDDRQRLRWTPLIITGASNEDQSLDLWGQILCIKSNVFHFYLTDIGVCGCVLVNQLVWLLFTQKHFKLSSGKLTRTDLESCPSQLFEYIEITHPLSTMQSTHAGESCYAQTSRVRLGGGSHRIPTPPQMSLIKVCSPPDHLLQSSQVQLISINHQIFIDYKQTSEANPLNGIPDRSTHRCQTSALLIQSQ